MSDGSGSVAFTATTTHLASPDPVDSNVRDTRFAPIRCSMSARVENVAATTGAFVTTSVFGMLPSVAVTAMAYFGGDVLFTGFWSPPTVNVMISAANPTPDVNANTNANESVPFTPSVARSNPDAGEVRATCPEGTEKYGKVTRILSPWRTSKV